MASWRLESIEQLIDRLEQETGRTMRRMAAALEIITRQKLGITVSAWRSWFADNGPTYTSGAVPLGDGETTQTLAITQIPCASG